LSRLLAKGGESRQRNAHFSSAGRGGPGKKESSRERPIPAGETEGGMKKEKAGP